MQRYGPNKTIKLQRDTKYSKEYSKSTDAQEQRSIIMTIVERFSQSGLYSPKRLKESGERTTLSIATPTRGVFSNLPKHGKLDRKKKKFQQFFSCLSQKQGRYYQDDDDDDEEYPDSPSSTIPLMMEEELDISNNPYYDSAVIGEVVGDESPTSIEVAPSLPTSSSVMMKASDCTDDLKMSGNYDESEVDSINNDGRMLYLEDSDRDREGVMIRWKSRINHCLKKALHHRRKGDKFNEGSNAVTMSNKHPSSSQPTLAAENRTYATECNYSEDSSLQVGGNLTRSSKSAFSPVEQVSSTEGSNLSSSSMYPTQERRNAPPTSPKVQISLYPYQVEVKAVSPDSKPPSPDGSGGFLAVSIEEECAQLVVQSPSVFDDDEVSTSSLLGVAFPYPSGPHDRNKGAKTNKHCLGVNSSHPNWLKQRMLDDVWGSVVSDPLEGGEITAPPSPTFVETKVYGMKSWSNDDMSVNTMDGTEAEDSISGIIPSQQEIETLFSSVCKPISCSGDSGLLAIDDELSDIHSVPFDEFRFDKVTSPGSSSRKGIDPDMMMQSQLSDCGSLVQPYLDDESLNGDGWTDYSDAVANMYTSMLGEMETKEE